MNKSLHYIFGLLFILTLEAHASSVKMNLFIQPGTLITVDNESIPYTTFNTVDSFTQENPVINLSVGDTLKLWVFNNDTINHQFQISEHTGTFLSIAQGDSAFLEKVFTNAGSFIYFDPLDYPNQMYLGLGGILTVKDHTYPSFYWNLKEHTKAWNTNIKHGGIENWATYSPTYFTVNGKSNPHINQDPNSRITGNVGDTLVVYMGNTGQSIHSLHYHGYHATILFSSKYPNHVSRSKDTFAIYPKESVVVQLVPDKPGEYPVHDHNLVAVSANNFYPNGIFTTLLIQP